MTRNWKTGMKRHLFSLCADMCGGMVIAQTLGRNPELNANGVDATIPANLTDIINIHPC